MKKLFALLLLSILIISCGPSAEDLEKAKIMSALGATDSLYATIHLIDTKEPNFLKGKNGACVYIPANAIHNPAQEKVVIILKEYLSPASMIDAGLSTSSNGQLLETGGMIHIRAVANGKELSLASGEGITVLFPKENKHTEKDFRLFYGEQDTLAGINWIPAPQETYKKDSARIVSEPGMFTYTMDGSPELIVWTPLENGMSTYNEFGFGNDILLKDGRYAHTVFQQKVDSVYTKEEIIYMETHFQNYLRGISFNLTHDGRMSDFKLYQGFEPYAGSDTMKTILQKLRTIIQKMPVIDMSPYHLTAQQTVVGEYAIAARKTLNRERFLKKMYFKKNADEIPVEITDYYLFSALKLGWLNCDRFYRNTSAKIPFTVTVDSRDSTNVYMVFSSFSGVLEGRKKGHVYTFTNIPSDQEVRIIALTHAGKKRRLSLMRTTASKKEATLSAFRSFTLEELDKALK